MTNNIRCHHALRNQLIERMNAGQSWQGARESIATELFRDYERRSQAASDAGYRDPRLVDMAKRLLDIQAALDAEDWDGAGGLQSQVRICTQCGVIDMEGGED